MCNGYSSVNKKIFYGKHNNLHAMFLSVTELIALISLCILTHFVIGKILSKRRPLAPGPRGFPVVGALPLLGRKPHVALAKMAKIYGPIMYLKAGSRGMVVASTPDAARSFLKTLESNFLNRPVHAGPTILAYDSQDLVFAPYGPRWRLLRKLSNLHMLGGKALDDWADLRAAELGHTLEAMYQSCLRGEAVALGEILVYAMANMIGRIILNRRVFVTKGRELNEFKDMVVELMTTAGYFNIGDFIPWMGRMDLQGIEKGMRKLHKKFDVFISRMLDEHLESRHERKNRPDLLDVLLANRDDINSSEEERLTTTNIKALLLNLFTAGTDTSSSAIEWALAEMLKNPDIMRKAHDEMDRVIGRNRRLVESDIPKLPYLQAICKETFRKHPSTPLNLPRISAEACTVNGYYIPKNTRLSVNIWAIGRDPQVWENPLDFNPERFLSETYAKIDPKGNDFELIPFGAGRRICAGTRMGVVMVEYILGTLVHSFDWKFDGEEMDMEETFGLALQKAVPLAAMVTPRLPPTCYLGSN